jgi:ABC-type maltose transport system permease subunit
MSRVTLPLAMPGLVTALIITIPVLILFALIERRVVGGLTAGSVK